MSTLKICVPIAVLLLAAGTAHANLVLNGDFETHSATISQYNLANTDFNALVPGITAFGASSELDLITSGAGWVIDPQSGSWEIGLHSQGFDILDAFSFNLAANVVSGTSYTLRFFAAGTSAASSATTVSVDVGLSNSATDFGSLIYTGSSPNAAAWTQYDHVFVAPMDAVYLTVRSVISSPYAVVDNFSLSPVPEPEAYTLMLAGLGLVAWAAARR